MYLELFSLSMAALLLASMNSSVMSLHQRSHRKITEMALEILFDPRPHTSPDILLDDIIPAGNLGLDHGGGEELHGVPQSGAGACRRGGVTVWQFDRRKKSSLFPSFNKFKFKNTSVMKIHYPLNYDFEFDEIKSR